MFQQKPMLGEQPDWSLFQRPSGLWVMNEGAGNKVFDLSGNNPVGTVYGTTAWVPGKFGSALDFLATSGNYVNTNAKQSVIDLPISANFAVVFWVAAATSDLDQAAIAFSGTDDLIIYPYDVNRIRIFWRDVAIALFTYSHSLAGTGFHQFAFVSYGLTDHRIFIDGVQVDTANDDASGAGAFSNLYLGAFGPSSQNFHGQIGHVEIYSPAPAPSQIAKLYINPFPWFERMRPELMYVEAVGVNAPTGALYGSLVGCLGGPI